MSNELVQVTGVRLTNAEELGEMPRTGKSLRAQAWPRDRDWSDSRWSGSHPASDHHLGGWSDFRRTSTGVPHIQRMLRQVGQGAYLSEHILIALGTEVHDGGEE